MLSEINVNWNQSLGCWGEVWSFLWCEEKKAEKSQRYSSKWAVLSAWLFLFSEGSRGEIIAAVRRRNWSFNELAHLDKLNLVVRCKWIKNGRRKVSLLPLSPHLLLWQQSELNGHKNHRVVWVRRDLRGHLVTIPQPWHPLDRVPRGPAQPGLEHWGTMLLVFCGSSHPLSCSKTLLLSKFTDVATPDCPSMCSKEVIIIN